MAILIFILGTVFGSFFLVYGTRAPKKENFITKRSHCDHCDHVLSWYELIPLVSFLIQGGKCRNCKNKISIEHFTIELSTGILFLAGYLYFGISLKYLIYLISISVTVIIFISDFKYMIILDAPLIIGSILVIIIRYFEVGLIDTLYSCMYGIILFILMYLIQLLGNKLLKKESLGGGDIKLSFFMGLVLGYKGFGFRLGLVSLVFSAFLALPYALASVYFNEKNELPYGPFLISSMMIVFTFIDKFINLLEVLLIV